jgi:hypothetical protein
MAEEQDFRPGEEQEIWLTEDEVQQLLQGGLLWAELEAERARAAEKAAAPAWEEAAPGTAAAGEVEAEQAAAEQALAEQAAAERALAEQALAEQAAAEQAEAEPAPGGGTAAAEQDADADAAAAEQAAQAAPAGADPDPTPLRHAAFGEAESQYPHGFRAAEPAPGGGTAAAEAAPPPPPDSRMPWEYTARERESLWGTDTEAPPWLAGREGESKPFDLGVNEMQRLITEEPDAPSSFGRGARLVALMAVLAAATFGLWWYFIYGA